MLRDIQFLFLLAILATACRWADKDIPEPNYNPHILKPGKYVPAQGNVINMDSVAPPVYIPAEGRYVKAGNPKYVPSLTFAFLVATIYTSRARRKQ